MRESLRIIGIDPGLRRTGWGIVDVSGSRISPVACGTILPKTEDPLASRLSVIFKELMQVLSTHSPHEAAVEETFVNKDAKATLKLGQARGIAMLAPAEFGIDVAEYAPNAVKKAVVGVGKADKAQVHHMVNILLPKAKPKTMDAADALAIAICHCHNRAAPRIVEAAE